MYIPTVKRPKQRVSDYAFFFFCFSPFEVRLENVTDSRHSRKLLSREIILTESRKNGKLVVVFFSTFFTEEIYFLLCAYATVRFTYNIMKTVYYPYANLTQRCWIRRPSPCGRLFLAAVLLIDNIFDINQMLKNMDVNNLWAHKIIVRFKLKRSNNVKQ